MSLLLPLLEKINNKSEEPNKDISILTYMKFLEATVNICKDYENMNIVGINIIKFMERSINQINTLQPYEQEVSYYKQIVVIFNKTNFRNDEYIFLYYD